MTMPRAALWSEAARSEAFRSLQWLQRSDPLQTPHRAGRRRELVHLQAHALEHGYKEIGQGIISLGIETQMLTMPETASGEDRR